MTKVEVKAGICGFTTQIEADRVTGYNAQFHLESECPNWGKVNKLLGGKELDMMVELFKNKETGEVNSQVIQTSLSTIPHVSCPVLSGLLKALEVSVGLALPKDANITFLDD